MKKMSQKQTYNHERERDEALGILRHLCVMRRRARRLTEATIPRYLSSISTLRAELERGTRNHTGTSDATRSHNRKPPAITVKLLSSFGRSWTKWNSPGTSGRAELRVPNILVTAIDTIGGKMRNVRSGTYQTDKLVVNPDIACLPNKIMFPLVIAYFDTLKDK